MTEQVFPDQSSAFGRRVHERLRDERVIWLTTVSADGTPQPTPVWFVRSGDSIVIYNFHSARRLASLRERPHVSLHLNSTDTGEDVVVLSGGGELDEQLPPAHESPEYLAKYGDDMTRVSGGVEEFSRTYSIPLRVHVTHVRGY